MHLIDTANIGSLKVEQFAVLSGDYGGVSGGGMQGREGIVNQEGGREERGEGVETERKEGERGRKGEDEGRLRRVKEPHSYNKPHLKLTP